jgi:hypothetical protein
MEDLLERREDQRGDARVQLPQKRANADRADDQPAVVVELDETRERRRLSQP